MLLAKSKVVIQQRFEHVFAQFVQTEELDQHGLDLIKEHQQLLVELSDNELSERFLLLADQLQEDSVSVDDVLYRCFAFVREAAARAMKMPHYDVQLLAGMAMCRNAIAEMATGEGKTLVATLPACYFALFRQGVHVMTVNAYLAERDCQLMRPLYELLGLTVGHIRHDMSYTEKKQAYQCDITYGVGSDFGFDYLKDQLEIQSMPDLPLGHQFRASMRGLALGKPKLVQRGQQYAIIDEADSVMLDEASSALILSGSSNEQHPFPQPYYAAKELADSLQRGVDYLIDETTGAIILLEHDQQDLYRNLTRESRLSLVRPWENYIKQALKALHIVRKDESYIVVDGKVQIVDEFTGRRFEDRSWSEGLHQAVEAKENMMITCESQSILKITRQRFFNLYTQGKCGMTGTAIGCEKELKQIFDLSVVAIPLRCGNKRKVLPTRFFANQAEKHQAIIRFVEQIHTSGQPILVGTRSIKQSEELAEQLVDKGLKVNLLNAKQDQHEAELIAQAGKKGKVTIATNMAGRGSDIPLSDKVKQLGGLVVVVSEPHLSNRVDRQLVGRCARQGNPGLAIMFVSAEDELLKHSVSLKNNIEQHGLSDDELHSLLLKLQFKLDHDAYQGRLKLFRYNKWVEKLLEKIS